VVEQLRKHEKVTDVFDEPSSHAPPESLAVQDRKDEPVTAIVPVELNKIAPPFASPERSTKMQSTTDTQSAVEEILFPLF
jgi:hypothetical protein